MRETITPQAMQALEQGWMRERGVPPVLLMEHAALGLAAAIRRRCAGRELPVLFLCGPGNNGGDGYAAARLWRAEGGQSLVWELKAPASETAALVRSLALEAGVPVETLQAAPDQLPPCALIVDALFGTGLSRAPEGLPAALIRLANGSGVPVLAADIPSGLNGETGEAYDPCVQAAETVTFHRMKQGLLLRDGCRVSGEITVHPILIPPQAGDVPGLRFLTPEELPEILPRRAPDSHKGTWGRAVLLVGSPGMAGAAALCAAACIRGGCGLTKILCPPELVPVLQVLVPGATCQALPEDPEAAAALARQQLESADRAAVGCGLGTRESLLPLLRVFREAACPVVWDADALNLLARHPEALPLPAHHVITPHPAEAARLLGWDTGAVTREPLAALRALRERCGCRVLLKGARTLMTDGIHEAIQPIGTPALAKGGSGDVLTGLLTALLRRTRPAEDALLPLQAACWLHVQAALRGAAELGEDALAPEELVRRIGQGIGRSTATLG
ncbi:MAG: NAD(P)H-hydrate dehydratase [Clostridia bacterium]|nr:NAD(P)H-hydrate dehydratase [Clostridia bacterium]